MELSTEIFTLFYVTVIGSFLLSLFLLPVSETYGKDKSSDFLRNIMIISLLAGLFFGFLCLLAGVILV